MMYDGVGGQVLYLPRRGRWAFDVASDWVKQRAFKGLFGTRPYSTLTTLASLHYRMTEGTTLTTRVGKFLAKDNGVRLEVSRRFRSGFKVGVWYTRTTGHDITSPGTPTSPHYDDKGVFMPMPLNTMLTPDTQAVAGFSLAPWTREVGQIVRSPGDLYTMTERDVLQMHDKDGLEDFGDRYDDYTLPPSARSTRRPWPGFLVSDAHNFVRAAKPVDWGQSLLVAGGLTLASSALDNRALSFANQHRNASWMKAEIRVGNALPFTALGLSAMFAFDTSRPTLSDAGVAALEAGATGYLLDLGLRYGVGRARPSSGLSHTTFKHGSGLDEYHSLPSNHVVAMWAAVTPYAQAFGMPWLYGVAALTNLSRIGGRDHWVSDTVASSLIGYGLGTLTREARHRSRLDHDRPSVVIGPNSVNLAWRFD